MLVRGLPHFGQVYIIWQQTRDGGEQEKIALTIALDALLTPAEQAGSWVGALSEAASEARGSRWTLCAELMPSRSR